MTEAIKTDTIPPAPNGTSDIFTLCDGIIAARNRMEAVRRISPNRTPSGGPAGAEFLAAFRVLRRLRHDLAQISATTPAALFRKAPVATSDGSAGTKIALSVAQDLTQNPAFRRLIWPIATDTEWQSPDHSDGAA